MEELANQSTDPAAMESAPKRNRGWFTPGDVRINRDGRPRANLSSRAWDRAPRADSLKLLRVHGRKFLHRFSNRLAPWIVNLPPDTQILACHFHAADNVIVFVLRSKSFEQIGRGAVIPEFAPQFNGLNYRQA